MRQNQRLRKITKSYKPLKDFGWRNFDFLWKKDGEAGLALSYKYKTYQALCPICCDNKISWRVNENWKKEKEPKLSKPICHKGHRFFLEDILLGEILDKA